MTDAYPIGAGASVPTASTTDADDNKYAKKDALKDKTPGMGMGKALPKGKHSIPFFLALTTVAWLVTLTCIWLSGAVKAAELSTLVYDTASGQRLPSTAQDRPCAAVAILLMLYPLLIADELLTRLRIVNSAATQWFLLHAIGNFVVAAGSLADFAAVAEVPTGLLSVARCSTLAFPACSDLPVGLIIAMHAYHMIRFALSADDLFHHIAFVPIIGGIRFVYAPPYCPWCPRGTPHPPNFLGATWQVPVWRGRQPAPILHLWRARRRRLRPPHPRQGGLHARHPGEAHQLLDQLLGARPGHRHLPRPHGRVVAQAP